MSNKWLRTMIAVATTLFTALSVFFASTQQSHAAGTKAKQSCVETKFIGVRGSGEATGLGDTVGAVYKAYAKQTKQKTSVYALDYPATSVPIFNPGVTVASFVNSVHTGKKSLTKYINEQRKACPQQKLVIAGFSQGALIVSSTLNQLPASTLKSISGVALLGDPNFIPEFKGAVGNFNPNHRGIASSFTAAFRSMNYVPSGIANKTRSYCLAYDPVCNNSIASSWHCFVMDAVCSHALYASKGHTTQAGTFLARPR